VACKALQTKNKELEATALKTKTAAEKAFKANADCTAKTVTTATTAGCKADKDAKDAADTKYAQLQGWVADDLKALTNTWTSDASQP
jgi:hypothetical protein